MIRKLLLKKSLFAVLLTLIGWTASAQVPETLSYQGILTQSNGAPVSDGAYIITFNFYDNIADVTPDLVRGPMTVNTFKGMFTTIIGDGSAGNAALPTIIGETQYYVGIKIGSDAELTPRVRLTTVPYAIKAQSANTMDAAGLTGSIDDTRLSTHLQDLSDGTLTGSKVGAGISAGNITGTLAVANGGTGASTLTGAVFGNGAGAFTSVSHSAGNQYLRRNSANTAYEFGALSISSGEISNNALTNPKIADDAVTAAKIGTAGAGDANKVLTTDASGNPQWELKTTVGITGSGASGQLSFWSGANSLSADANLFWDNANDRLGIGTSPLYPLSVYTALNAKGQNIEQDYAGAAAQFGLTVDISSATGTGAKTGIQNTIAGTTGNSSANYGIQNVMTPNGSGNVYGVQTTISNAGAGSRWGSQHVISGSAATGDLFGVENIITPNGNSTVYGTYNSIPNAGTVGTGIRYGTFNQVYGLIGASNPIYGSYNFVDHLGNGMVMGNYNSASSGGTGAVFGELCEVAKGAGLDGDVYGLSVFSLNNGKNNTYLLHAVTYGTPGGTEYGLYTENEDMNYISGKLGIGQPNLAALGSHKVYIAGTGFISGGAWAASDVRYKKDFKKLTGSLDKIMKLEGVSYAWKREENPEMELPDGRHYGFKAQEVEKVFPELILTDDTGYKAMNYSGMSAVLLEAIKEQQDLITKQQSLIENQNTSIDELKAQVEELKNLVMAQLKTQSADSQSASASGEDKK